MQTLIQEQITQTELEDLVLLQANLKAIKAAVAKAEQSITSKLEKGLSVESGTLTARMKGSTRRSPTWKTEALVLALELGKDAKEFEQAVLEATPEKITRSLKVEVK